MNPIVPITQDTLDQLDMAIASGVRMVQINGETVNYQTTENMIKAADYIRGRLQNGQVTTSSANARLTKTYYGGRGYES